MSNAPNNPFEPNQPDQGYAQQGYDQPPPKKSKAKFWLIGCGITGFLGLLVCCGGPLLMTQFGMSMMAGEFQKQLEGDPVIVEHIGEIESLNMSWGETISQAQKQQGGGAEEIAFTIEGTKGSGVVMIQQAPGGDGMGMASARLIMPDGEEYPIDVGMPESSAEDIDLDSMFDEGDVPAPDMIPAESP